MTNQTQTVFLDIREVVKKYATKTAVNHISLKIPAGVIFGLLGPNGAGKTSLIRMITGITAPDAGEIYFGGKLFTEADQQRIGYMPEERGLYKNMKVGEQLIYLLRLKGMQNRDAHAACDYWLERMEIAAWKPRKVSELSKGMQQKIQFIATIAHKPELLILDEPFSGLDPLNSRLVEDVIHELKKQGSTILFSTHRMEQVEQLCDEIALVDQGRIVLEGNVGAIRKAYRKEIYNITAMGITDALLEHTDIKILSRNQEHVQVELKNDFSPKAFIHLLNENTEIQKFELHLPSLSDIFIQVVSQKNG